MKKIFLAFLILLSSISCKKNNNSLKASTSVDVQIKDKSSSEKIYYSCEDLIRDIVESSNAQAFKNFNEVKTKITNISDEKISVELYILSDSSEMSVGWIEFFPTTGLLKDITNDPENPVNLKFNKGILENNDFIKTCNLTTNFTKAASKTNNDKVKCYKKNINEYSFIDICEYEGVTDLNYLYRQLSKEFEQNDLLKILPKKDTVYSTLSTPEINYLIKRDKITIKVLSEGGETVLSVYQNNNRGYIEAIKSID